MQQPSLNRRFALETRKGAFAERIHAPFHIPKAMLFVRTIYDPQGHACRSPLLRPLTHPPPFSHSTTISPDAANLRFTTHRFHTPVSQPEPILPDSGGPPSKIPPSVPASPPLRPTLTRLSRRSSPAPPAMRWHSPTADAPSCPSPLPLSAAELLTSIRDGFPGCSRLAFLTADGDGRNAVGSSWKKASGSRARCEATIFPSSEF